MNTLALIAKTAKSLRSTYNSDFKVTLILARPHGLEQYYVLVTSILTKRVIELRGRTSLADAERVFEAKCKEFCPSNGQLLDEIGLEIYS